MLSESISEASSRLPPLLGPVIRGHIGHCTRRLAGGHQTRLLFIALENHSFRTGCAPPRPYGVGSSQSSTGLIG